MKRKIMLISPLLVVGICSLAACGTTDTKMIEAGDITEKNVEQVCEVMRDAGLSNVDIFEKWVKESFAKYTETNEETSGFTDADCRMTVMLLGADIIKSDSVEEKYTGDYLMFDVDAIENDKRYSVLKEKEQLFTTMFGEMPISKKGFAETLPDTWEKYGIRVESEKNAVISILFKAYEQEEAFVGHTGLLIDSGDSKYADSDYLFVEKIAFGDPFKVTPVKDEKELLDILSKRPDYTVEDGEPAPVVYKNSEVIGELTQAE